MQNLTLDSSNEVDIDPLVWVVTTVFIVLIDSRYLEENQPKNLKIIIKPGVKNVEEFLFGDNVLVIKASTELWWTGVNGIKLQS